MQYQELLQALRLGSFRRGIEFQDDILIAVVKDVRKAAGDFEEKRGLVGGPRRGSTKIIFIFHYSKVLKLELNKKWFSGYFRDLKCVKLMQIWD